MSKIATHRIVVLESLLAIEQGRHAEDCLDDCSLEDRPLVQHVLYGVLRWRGSLDKHLCQFVRKNPKKIIRNILRIAMFEHFFSSTPTHALLHQAVELCRHVGRRNDAKFVNAILRKSIQVDLDTDPYNDLPDWLTERWREYPEWVSSLRQQPAIAFCYQALEDNGITESEEELVSIGGEVFSQIRYPRIKGSISSQKGYSEGKWWVMNPAAAYSIELLSKQVDLREKRVLDMCAAPGGKSFCLAAKGATVLATDSSAKRLAVMKENVDRLNLSEEIELRQHDWQGSLDSDDKYDVVVLDAPCSGTGVIRKHPEIKWRRCSQDILAASILQKRLLKKAQQQVKKGGLLLYCVCSVLEEEGEAVVSRLKESQWKRLVSWNSLSEKDPRLDGFQVFVMEHIGEENDQ